MPHATYLPQSGDFGSSALACEMAEGRSRRIGTVFSRVKGLIQGGAIKYEERPVWFDVYRAFPPAEEPLYEKPVRTTDVGNIFYPEDAIRAQFYKTYTSGIVNLATEEGHSACDQFVREYIRLSNDSSIPKSDLHNRTRALLEEQGLFLVTQEEFAAKEAEQRQLHLQRLEQRQREQREQQETSDVADNAVDSKQAASANMSSGKKSHVDAADDSRSERTHTAKSEKSKMSLEKNENEMLPSLGGRK